MGRGPDMPAWIEETLLVLEAFNDPRSGFEYRRGIGCSFAIAACAKPR